MTGPNADVKRKHYSGVICWCNPVTISLCPECQKAEQKHTFICPDILFGYADPLDGECWKCGGAGCVLALPGDKHTEVLHDDGPSMDVTHPRPRSTYGVAKEKAG